MGVSAAHKTMKIYHFDPLAPDDTERTCTFVTSYCCPQCELQNVPEIEVATALRYGGDVVPLRAGEAGAFAFAASRLGEAPPEPKPPRDAVDEEEVGMIGAGDEEEAAEAPGAYTGMQVVGFLPRDRVPRHCYAGPASVVQPPPLKGTASSKWAQGDAAHDATCRAFSALARAADRERAAVVVRCVFRKARAARTPCSISVRTPPTRFACHSWSAPCRLRGVLLRPVAAPLRGLGGSCVGGTSVPPRRRAARS